jgi:hypothetical protein
MTPNRQITADGCVKFRAKWIIFTLKYIVYVRIHYNIHTDIRIKLLYILYIEHSAPVQVRLKSNVGTSASLSSGSRQICKKDDSLVLLQKSENSISNAGRYEITDFFYCRHSKVVLSYHITVRVPKFHTATDFFQDRAL